MKKKTGEYREEKTLKREKDPERGTDRVRQAWEQWIFDTRSAEGEETPGEECMRLEGVGPRVKQLPLLSAETGQRSEE